ncbi:MAG: hypothetical protein DRJ96_08135 [Thermoprotei archaeon]|nr:MAG: hypothetical protein DRJ96_08135 [Thermoprotei archaeon]
MDFLNGVDANYVPLMRGLGFEWRTRRGEPIGDLYRFLAEKGVNCARVRLWVGDEGPCRLRYASLVMEMARRAGMSIYLVIFLSEGWADLYKQPAPRAWAALSVEERAAAAERYVAEVVERILQMEFRPVLYQVGNEVDYGLCGIFASDKKRRRDLRWLKRRIWRREAEILRAALSAVRSVDPAAVTAIHLGKWWDHRLIASFLAAMEEYGLEYDVLCISFYPSMFGASFSVLEELSELARDLGRQLVVAEYAYPSRRPRGQFWFMGRESPGYPLTREGQAKWIRDFISCAKRLGLRGAFYWSPEVYVTARRARRLKTPPEMPLSFGWSPMALFDERGREKAALNSLKAP